MALLRHDITPIVPLRGSISASGDLSPLSYIAGAIEGNPDIHVRYGKVSSRTMIAQQALKEAGLQSVTLRAKEGLGLINGTAFSAAIASLALHQSQELTVLSEILTGMSVEAEAGTAESFWPAIGRMRPHPGQQSAAGTILACLGVSRLAECVETPRDTKTTGLFQDRYALRTAPQWIGPQIEDLLHAKIQLQREINSTTDNPLIDTEGGHILHGGNFQAAVVTSAMDRMRLAIDKLGRMLFAQGTEIINPSLNNGLPANLASDDPSLSFTCKGIDINLASYASELGFLANPVGNHVMSAEMHNQAINSLAFMSASHTLQALDVLRIMSASFLFVLCQALDLRVLQVEFLDAVEAQIHDMLTKHFVQLADDERKRLGDTVFDKVSSAWPKTTNGDLPERCSAAADAVISDVVVSLTKSAAGGQDLTQITDFVAALKMTLESTYDKVRRRLYADHLAVTTSYLGQASKRMYTYVRKGLGVHFHQGLIEHPTQPAQGVLDEGDAAKRQTIGSNISIIDEALQDGRAGDVLADIIDECEKQTKNKASS